MVDESSPSEGVVISRANTKGQNSINSPSLFDEPEQELNHHSQALVNLNTDATSRKLLQVPA